MLYTKMLLLYYIGMTIYYILYTNFIYILYQRNTKFIGMIIYYITRNTTKIVEQYIVFELDILCIIPLFLWYFLLYSI